MNFSDEKERPLVNLIGFETAPVVIVPLKQGDKWVLYTDLVYNDPEFGLIAIPAGFKTDFASVPRIPLIFEMCGDMGQAAALVHDFLYTEGHTTRAQTDKIFLNILLTTGVGKVRAYAMYAGVRSFGWMFWRK